jgi:nitrite reductase (NO-forming)
MGWLFAAVAVTLVHPFVPTPRWLLLHLLLLGAVTHAILVWSRHFAETLLHLPPADRTAQSRRLLLHNAGALAVITGQLTSIWPVTAAGAASVATAVVWHGARLVQDLRTALPSRFAVTVRFYVAAACFLPVGAVLGTLLARHPADPWHIRLLFAHAVVNLLGWVGLTVVGTLVTLWPTVLRTRIASGATRAAGHSLPVLVGGVALAASGALVGQLAVTALGVGSYVVGLGIAGRGLVVPLRMRRPVSYAAWSMLAAVSWLVGCLVALTLGLNTARTWPEAHATIGWLVPFLAAGFAAQVLLGALSHLVPVALGGGPTPVRAAHAVLDRGASLRVVVTNAGLLVCAAPVPSAVRVLVSALVLAALASTLPLLLLAIRASRAARTVPATERSAQPLGERAAARAGRARTTQGAAAGLALVVLAVAAGVAVDPSALSIGTSTAAGARPTGHTTTVEVVARDMRFTPATIDVPFGDRLVIVLTNADDDVHDLALDSGATTGRLAPGDQARLAVGVVGRDLDGWCTVVGHRQMGMVLGVRVIGAQAADHGDQEGGGHDHGDQGGDDQEIWPADGEGDDAADDLNLMATPGAGFKAADATLTPLEATRVHRRTITVREDLREVAPGVEQRLWTYDGSMPGPVLHGRVGDRFVITLVNDGSIGHSIDFHAGALAPQRPMRTIAPGESLVYRFRATRAGIWMYHCSTMPMSAHIANGLFGAVVIEPRGLPRVDRSYFLAQSELYLGPQQGTVDVEKLTEERPDAVAFNGYADQYDHQPLTARVGERVRIWVLDAGPNRATSFHVVGGQFDTVWAEGAYLLDRRDGGSGGSQALALAPAQGGFVELSFPEPGSYPFVSHVMVDAERGAHGEFLITR